MDRDDGTVQGDGFDLHADDLRLLQLCKDAIQHPALRPTIHASINGVPVAEPLGQTAPFAPLLGDVQDGVQDVQTKSGKEASSGKDAKSQEKSKENPTPAKKKRKRPHRKSDG